MIILPNDWKFDKESLSKDEWKWPFIILTAIAYLPIGPQTVIGCNHTMSFEGLLNFSDCTDMCCGILTEPRLLPNGIPNLKYGFPKKEINFLCLTTLTKDEFTEKNNMGEYNHLNNVIYNDVEKYLVIKNKR